jgi:hypothetical protein
MFKSGGFENRLKIPDTDICHLIGGTLNSPFEAIWGFFRTFDSLMKICDSLGDIRMVNVSFTNATFIRFWPDGNYKTTLKMYDNIDENIFTITYKDIVKH